MTDNKCPYCGCENAEDAAFCDECGSKLESNNKKITTTAIIAAAVVIVVAIIAITICAVTLKNRNSAHNSAVPPAQQNSTVYAGTTVPTSSPKIVVVPSTNPIVTEPSTVRTVNINPEETHEIPLAFTATAITVLSDELGNNYVATNLVDGNTSTCWAEGADGSGIGETFIIKGNKPFYADTLTFYNGYCKSQELFYNNNRVKKIRITPDSGESFTAELNDGFENRRNVVNCGHTLVNSITFEILEVYEGEKYNDTCISEIYVNQP